VEIPQGLRIKGCSKEWNFHSGMGKIVRCEEWWRRDESKWGMALT
jgi:hypothetical protein